MRYPLVMAVAVFAAQAATAQDAITTQRTVHVAGNGRVSTMPNVAVIEYWAVGEGSTPDEASRALVATRKAISEQLTRLLGGSTTVTDSNLIIVAARDPRCANPGGRSGGPRLSQGDCAIVGYEASAQGRIRTSEISKAGTAVGLASRLGARDARLQGFQLADDRAARRSAVAEAVADATRQASAIATAADRRLGPIISIRDHNSGLGEIVVRAPGVSISPPPPPPPPPPVEIDVNPRPVETNARVDVTFALLP